MELRENLNLGAELECREQRMDDDKEKQLDDGPIENSEVDDGAVLDEGWAEVDLRNRKKTPEADLPSELEA